MTATGKIQKNRLMNQIQDGAIAPVDWKKPARASASLDSR
jgi:hypothetical protein